MGALGLAETELEGERELDGLSDAEGEPEALELGESDADGEIEAELLLEGDNEALGLSEAEAELEALLDGERLAEGLLELEGDIEVLALGLKECEADELALDDGDTLAEGLIEADGERDTEKDCMQISQFSLVEPETFLNSKISPKTLPAGWGPYLTVEGRGPTVPSCLSQVFSDVFRPLKPVLASSRAVITPLRWSVTLILFMTGSATTLLF